MKTLDGREIIGEKNINGKRMFIIKNKDGGLEEQFSSLITSFSPIHNMSEPRKIIKSTGFVNQLKVLEDKISKLEQQLKVKGNT